MLRLSSAGDLAHGIVKAQAQDLDEELDGVAGQFALGPAPVAVFEEQAREGRSEEHTSELQSQSNLVCRLLLEKKKKRSHLPLLSPSFLPGLFTGCVYPIPLLEYISAVFPDVWLVLSLVLAERIALLPPLRPIR